MVIETLIFKEIGLLPELFLGISLIYLALHGTFLSVSKNYPLLQISNLYLSVLVLSMVCFLLMNDGLEVLDSSIFNNTVVTDYLGYSSKLLLGISCIFCLLIIQQYVVDQKQNNFEYILLFLFAILGIFLLCSSNDLITAYLAIELQSLAFYVLAAFKKNSTFSADAGLKYFILGAFSSSLFLFGSSIIYGVTGTTNFEDFKDLFFGFFPGGQSSLGFSLSKESVPVHFEIPFDASLLNFALVFILASLFFKLALAPFHLWSPDVYEGSLSSSTFFFAVIPKLGIFVLLLRIFYYSFYSFIDNWRYYVVIISILSVIVGSFVGLEQRKLKSLLAYSSISHMGYSLISFTTGTFEGIQMLLCYLIIYICSGLCIWSIFLLTRVKISYVQKQNKDLTDFVLLSKSNKTLAIFLATVLLSVAGFPPMIGFLVKIGVFLASIESSMYFIALISILCSVISTFYYIRIVKILFFEKVLVGKLYHPIKAQRAVIVTFLFYLLLFLFINPTLLYLVSQKISLGSLINIF